MRTGAGRVAGRAMGCCGLGYQTPSAGVLPGGMTSTPAPSGGEVVGDFERREGRGGGRAGILGLDQHLVAVLVDVVNRRGGLGDLSGNQGDFAGDGLFGIVVEKEHEAGAIGRDAHAAEQRFGRALEFAWPAFGAEELGPRFRG